MALLAPARASACKYADTSPTWRDAKSRCPISLTISSEALVGSRSARDRTACVRTMVSGSARAVSSKSSESLPPISASERTVSRLRRVDRGASWCGVRSLLPSGRQFYRPGGRCSLLHTIDDPQCTCAADPRWAPSLGKEHSAGTCATAAHRPRSVSPADEESRLALILPTPPEGLPGLQGGCLPARGLPDGADSCPLDSRSLGLFGRLFGVRPPSDLLASKVIAPGTRSVPNAEWNRGYPRERARKSPRALLHGC